MENISSMASSILCPPRVPRSGSIGACALCNLEIPEADSHHICLSCRTDTEFVCSELCTACKLNEQLMNRPSVKNLAKSKNSAVRVEAEIHSSNKHEKRKLPNKSGKKSSPKHKKQKLGDIHFEIETISPPVTPRREVNRESTLAHINSSCLNLQGYSQVNREKTSAHINSRCLNLQSGDSPRGIPTIGNSSTNSLVYTVNQSSVPTFSGWNNRDLEEQNMYANNQTRNVTNYQEAQQKQILTATQRKSLPGYQDQYITMPETQYFTVPSNQFVQVPINQSANNSRDNGSMYINSVNAPQPHKENPWVSKEDLSSILAAFKDDIISSLKMHGDKASVAESQSSHHSMGAQNNSRKLKERSIENSDHESDTRSRCNDSEKEESDQSGEEDNGLIHLAGSSDRTLAEISHLKQIVKHKLQGFPLWLSIQKPELFEEKLAKSTAKTDFYRQALVTSDLSNHIFESMSSIVKPPIDAKNLANMVKVNPNAAHWQGPRLAENLATEIPGSQRSIGLKDGWKKLGFFLESGFNPVTLPPEILASDAQVASISSDLKKKFLYIQGKVQHMIWQMQLTFNLRTINQFNNSDIFQNYVKEMSVL